MDGTIECLYKLKEILTIDEYNLILNSTLHISNNSNIDNSYEKYAILEACRLLNISERDLINKEYKIFVLSVLSIAFTVIIWN